jgi:hypothetical protein
VQTSDAAALAVKLGRSPNFLIGMGNDLAADHNQDGAFNLGTTIDLHYAYLSAYLNADSLGQLEGLEPRRKLRQHHHRYGRRTWRGPHDLPLLDGAAAGDGVLAGLSSDVFEKVIGLT